MKSRGGVFTNVLMSDIVVFKEEMASSLFKAASLPLLLPALLLLPLPLALPSFFSSLLPLPPPPFPSSPLSAVGAAAATGFCLFFVGIRKH